MSKNLPITEPVGMRLKSQPYLLMQSIWEEQIRTQLIEFYVVLDEIRDLLNCFWLEALCR